MKEHSRNYHHQLDLWDKIWRDSDGQVVIWQWPNVWLIGWAVLDIISIFAPYKRVSEFTWALGAVALTIWALLEVFRGVNYFRRGLGVIVLLLTIASVFKVGL